MSERSRELARWGIAGLRIIVGVIFFVHGLQKVFAFGFAGTTDFLAGMSVPAPGLSAALLIGAELLGGLFLILGIFTKPATMVLAVDNFMALALVHIPNGFYVGNDGAEFVLTLLAVNLALYHAGPGALALRNLILKEGSSGT
jgi:putative oxidoreductase